MVRGRPTPTLTDDAKLNEPVGRRSTDTAAPLPTNLAAKNPSLSSSTNCKLRAGEILSRRIESAAR